MNQAKPELGLYDSDSGKSLLADRIADASHLCPESARCVIKYANAVRGRIAQLCDWYEAERDLGVNVHYFVSETTPEALAQDEVFVRRATVMGADALTLARFVFENGNPSQLPDPQGGSKDMR